MEVIEEHDKYGWITAIICGRWVQAKVYQEPSCFGVNDCRVSKLAIGKTDSRDEGVSFFEQMDYNYDRGLDFNRLHDDDILNSILLELNGLPKDNCRDL
jgi:hypothetical protein